MTQISRLLIFIIVMFTLSFQKKTTKKAYVFARAYDEQLKSELTIASIGSANLKCNQEQLICVRWKAKKTNDLVLSGIGCMIKKRKEKGMYIIKCVCNERIKEHTLSISLRQEHNQFRILGRFDLNKVLI